MNAPASYVYNVLVDGALRYIGKGTGRRAQRHIQNARVILEQRRDGRPTRKTQKLFYDHLCAALDHGRPVEIVIVQKGLSHAAANALEKDMIASSRAAGVVLWNVLDGGEGVSSAAARAMWADPVWREERLRQLANPATRQKFRDGANRRCSRPEQRERFSQLAKSMWADPECRQKMIAAVTEYWSPDARQKKSIAVKAYMAANPERCASQKATLKAAMASPGVRAKARDSANKRWAIPGAREAWSERIQGDAEFRGKLSSGIKAAFDPARRARYSEALKALWADPDFKAKRAAQVKAGWANSGSRAKASASRKRAWADPGQRARMLAGKSTTSTLVSA